jgi:hypothetical protein
MLLVLVLYACATSFYMRMHWHQKLVVPERTLLPWFGSLYLRTLIPMTLMGIWWVIFTNGDLKDPLGPGMREWIIDHFRVDGIWKWSWPWFLTNAAIYFVLALPKEATYKSALFPGQFNDTAEPELLRVNMRNSLIWNAIFYAAVFINPTLPFGYSIVEALKGNL